MHSRVYSVPSDRHYKTYTKTVSSPMKEQTDSDSRNLLSLPADSAHTCPILPLQLGLDRGHLPKCRGHRSKDGYCHIIIGKQEYGPAYTQ
jgi:hypothetical protein